MGREADSLPALSRRALFFAPDPHEPGWFVVNPLAREFVGSALPAGRGRGGRAAPPRRRPGSSGQGRADAALRLLTRGGRVGPADPPAARARPRALGRGRRRRGDRRCRQQVPVSARDGRRSRRSSAAPSRSPVIGRALWPASHRIAAGAVATRLPASPGGPVLIHHLRGHLDEALELSTARGRRRRTASPRDDVASLLAWRGERCTGSAAGSPIAATARRPRAPSPPPLSSDDPQALAACVHTVLGVGRRGSTAIADRQRRPLPPRARARRARAGSVLQVIRIRTNRGSRSTSRKAAYEAALARARPGADAGRPDGVRLVPGARPDQPRRGLSAPRAARRGRRRPGGREGDLPAHGLPQRGLPAADAGRRLRRTRRALAGPGRVRGGRRACRSGRRPAGARSRAGGTGTRARARRARTGERRSPNARSRPRPGTWYRGRPPRRRARRARHPRPRTRGRERRRRGRGGPRAPRPRRPRRSARGAGACRAPRNGRQRCSRRRGRSGRRSTARSARPSATSSLARARRSRGDGARGLGRAAPPHARGPRPGRSGRVSPRSRLARESTPPVSILTLGGFRVLRYGEPVPLNEWQSKKARDLLKILIARARPADAPRHGDGNARGPSDDPGKVAGRLSVALAVLRSVLDPEKRFTPDHFVHGEQAALRVELAHVPVDVESFLGRPPRRLALARAGRPEAADRLAAAEAAYAGDFLEEDLYEEWAAPLREETQAAYIQVARALAAEADGRGDYDAQARYLLRVLERDPYDEPAQVALVGSLASAGRHGEARRFVPGVLRAHGRDRGGAGRVPGRRRPGGAAFNQALRPPEAAARSSAPPWRRSSSKSGFRPTGRRRRPACTGRSATLKAAATAPSATPRSCSVYSRGALAPDARVRVVGASARGAEPGG